MQGFIFKNRYLRRFPAVIAGLLSIVPLLRAEPSARPANHTERAELPPLLEISPSHALPPLRLPAAARHTKELISENSSLEKCSKAENVFWTINDSGAGPYLLAVSAEGETIKPETASKKFRGTHLAGRRNIDWETIAADGKGNLIIGDIGNNRSNRRNLCFYIVPEPDPKAETTAPSEKISFYYPTQDFFPDPSRNFDAEACFALNNFIYFFTKHWSNTETVLWRVDPSTEKYQAAVPVARFNARGLVTDAALSEKRDRLAVLTYHSVWLFDLPREDVHGKRDEQKFFDKPRYRKISVPVSDWQIEGITFLDEKTLLISSESGALFRLPIEEIK